MENKPILMIGQGVGIYALSGLPLMKIAQRENTIYFDEKMYLVGRVLGIDDRNICMIPNETKNILIITPMGFVISSHREYIQVEPRTKMECFLQEQEDLLTSQRYIPYNGKLQKVNNVWEIPKFI